MEAMNEDEHEEDDEAITIRKEQIMASIVYGLQKGPSENLVAENESHMNKGDTKLSTLCTTGDDPSAETKCEDVVVEIEKKKESVSDLLVDECDVKEKEVVALQKETVPISSKVKNWKERLERTKTAKNSAPWKRDAANKKLELAMQQACEQVFEPEEDEESKEEEKPIYILHPHQIPLALRRRKSDFTETFDTFESMLNKKTKNVLAMADDDDQSAWTEFIIGDKEGREQYRQNKIKQRCISHTSDGEETVRDGEGRSYAEFTVGNNETHYDERTLISKGQPSVAPVPLTQNSNDDQSYMDFTVLDNTVAISYLEDDEDYVAPEQPPEDYAAPGQSPKDYAAPEQSLEELQVSEDDDKSHFHILTNSNYTMDDDDMTQITMDHALMRHRSMRSVLVPQKMNDNHNAPVYPSKSVVPETLTSKNRIREILWSNLYSRDTAIVSSAMEDLRTIVASEPESRKHILRIGGVMAIMGTMEEYSKEETIQYLACIIIELLASMEPDGCKIVNEIEGIQQIVQSMQHQAGSSRVQDAGRAALATICRR